MRLLESLNPPEIVDALERVARTAPDGAFVEVGVYYGGTLKVLSEVAQERKTTILAFDTFTGIPHKDEIDLDEVGKYNSGLETFIELRRLLPAVRLFHGVFPECAESLDFPPLSFVHLDVDNYKGYRDSIDFLFPKMVEGGIMFFDDYGLPGARKAIEESFGHDVTTINFDPRTPRAFHIKRRSET